MKSAFWSAVVCFCWSFEGLADSSSISGSISIDEVKERWDVRESRLTATDFRIRWREAEIEPPHEDERNDRPLHSIQKENQRPARISSRCSLLSSNGRIRLEALTSMRRGSTGRWEPATVTTVSNRELGKSLFEYDEEVADNYGRVSKDPLLLVDMKVRAPFLGIWPASPAYGHINLAEYDIESRIPLVNGAPCLLLVRKDAGPVETELYLDASNDFAVVRVIGRSGKSIDRQINIECQDFAGLGPVPKRWQLTFWNSSLNEIEENGEWCCYRNH